MPFCGPRNDANALRFGRIFAGQVLEAAERIEVTDQTTLAGARVIVDLPVRPDWLRLLQAEQAQLAQEFAAVQVQNPVLSPILAEGVIHTEVQAIRVNDLALVGLPGEVMTSTGRKIKSAYSEAAVVELANDCVGYILTPEAAAEGGYETGLHLWTRVTAEAEAALLEAAQQALAGVFRAGSAGEAVQQPNIILITTDQQRYDTLGVTGNPHIHTPHLDALANRGTLFEHAYVQSPVCIPSRASLMTGRYLHQHGVTYMANAVDTTPGLPSWEISFMERLQAAGYHTGATGKIHMNPPRGFDYQRLCGGKGFRWTQAEGLPIGPAPLGPAYASWLEASATPAATS